MPRKGVFEFEIGRIGLKHSVGYVYDEFLTTLRGTRGRKIYREMTDNDPIIGAVLFAIKQILREARWDVKPGDDTDAQCKKDAEFLEDCMYQMNHSWSELMTDTLTFLSYGFSVFEQVLYRDRDGKVRWKKMAFRQQDTIERWEIDEYSDTQGFWQRPPPDFHEFYIPIKKCLHFKTESAGGNPEGRSALRNAFRPWFMKKNIEEIEAIGVERDLAGLPVLTLPEGMDPTSEDEGIVAQIASAKKLVTNIRRDEQEGIVMPFGWDLQLLAAAGSRQMDTVSIINRYNKEMAVSVLAQFIMLGMERTGSYALAKEQTDMFYLALESWIDYVGTIWNRQAVPILMGLNGVRDRPLPYFVHTQIHKYTLKDIATYVATLAGEKVNALEIDDDVRGFLKRYGRLEEFSERRR